MIWARLLRTGGLSTALWNRLGLKADAKALLQSGVEQYALVTGLTPDDRETLADYVGSGWLGGFGDSAVVKLPSLSLRSGERAGERGPVAALNRLTLLDQSPARTQLMGIVNVTPDSFSDGGDHFTPARAVAYGKELISQGAHFLDIGGESTRPGAAPVSETEELERVLPVIEGLKGAGAVISIDTYKPGVAKRAVEAGATFINDVSGLRDDAMVDVLAATGAHACVMHMKGTPQTMQDNPVYEDVVAEVLDALELALRRAEARGVAREKLYVDPGIGFGKSDAHNLFLLRRIGDLRLLGCKVLVGASRKGFLGRLTSGKAPKDRVAASAAVAAIMAASGGVDVLRVHDVAQTADAVAVAEALRGARDGGSRFAG